MQSAVRTATAETCILCVVINTFADFKNDISLAFISTSVLL